MRLSGGGVVRRHCRGRYDVRIDGHRVIFSVIRSALLSLALATLLLPGAALAGVQTIVVFAASSTKNALDEAIRQFTEQTGDKAVASYAATSVLARQIASGAPASLIIAADAQWMDYLQSGGFIQADTRVDLAGNRLALIRSSRFVVPANLLPVRVNMPLAQALSPDGRLAIADWRHVPAGRYARAALESLGLWAALADKLAPAGNVRHALALVARGESPLGIVYATDVYARDAGNRDASGRETRAGGSPPAVVQLGLIPGQMHPPIRYPAALTRTGATPQATALLAFLASPAGQAIFQQFGFAPVAR
ncbi:MAG: molybdate ABC transporter substrate-binding protein [Burkholderiaceae bacterium]